MSNLGKEGTAIARLLASDEQRIVGWLYVFDTGELGIKWEGPDREVRFVDRTLDHAILSNAGYVGDVAIADFPESLPVSSS